MVITGKVGRVVYLHESNGYAVFSLDVNDSDGGMAVQQVSCVGTLPAVREGDELKLTGKWQNHPRFGRQFAFREYERILPKSRPGLITYLANVAYGVGVVKAQRIVEHLGEDVLDIIKKSPHRLLEVRGISDKQADEIVAKLNEDTVLAKLTSLICRDGVSLGLAVRIYNQYGSEAIEKVKENPYILADEVWGVGFKTADRIAQGIGIKPDNPFRVEAAIKYILQEAGSGEGHVYLPPRELCDRVRPLLGRGAAITGRDIAEAVRRLEKQGAVRVLREGVREVETAIYATVLWKAEEELARKVRLLCESLQGEGGG